MEIRKFQPKDTDEIRKICIATASGKYATKPKYQEICCLLYVDYFLKYEPENCFVIDEDGHVKGYIVCSTNRELFKTKMIQDIAKKVKKLSFVHYLFTKLSTSVSDKLNKDYNGQFHINIAPDSQGKNYGPKLLDTLALHLNSIGQKYMYLITANKKTRGYSFYKHYGFKEVKRYFQGSIALTFNTADIKKVR